MDGGMDWNNNVVYINAGDSIRYESPSRNMYNNDWTNNGNVEKQIAIDQADNRNIALLSTDGKVIWVVMPGKQWITLKPPSNDITFTSITFMLYIWASGSDGRLYVTDKYAYESTNSWKQTNGTGIKKVLQIHRHVNELWVLTWSNQVYRSNNGDWPPRTNPDWQLIPEIGNGVSDAAVNNYGDLWYTNRNGDLFKFKHRDDKTPIPMTTLPYGCNGVAALYANNNGCLGIIGNNGTFFFSDENIYDNRIKWQSGYLYNLRTQIWVWHYRTQQGHGLGFWCGNNVMLTRMGVAVTLNNVPVSYWREGVEYWNNGCRGVGIGEINKNRVQYGPGGFPIEAPRIIKCSNTPYGCTYDGAMPSHGSWNYVREDGLTHIFGDILGDLRTFPNGRLVISDNQYQSKLPNGFNAAQLGITPFEKVMSDDYGGTPPNKPKFKSVKFNLPDPTDTVDIDPNIPSILIGYYENRMLPDLNFLNGYLAGWAFSPMVDTDGIKKPRCQLLKYKDDNLVNTFMSKWPNLGGVGSQNKFIDSKKTAYCTGENLATPYCQDICSAPLEQGVGSGGTMKSGINCDSMLDGFCQTKGPGQLPDLTGGVLPVLPITQQMLDDAYPNYAKYPQICGCNMPGIYNNLVDAKNYQEFSDSYDTNAAIYKYMFGAKAVGGNPSCDPYLTCRSDPKTVPNRAKGGCTEPTNVAVCVQSAKSQIGNVRDSQDVGNILQKCNINMNTGGGDGKINNQSNTGGGDGGGGGGGGGLQVAGGGSGKITQAASPGNAKSITTGTGKTDLLSSDYEGGWQSYKVSKNTETSVIFTSIPLTASTKQYGRLDTHYPILSGNKGDVSSANGVYQASCILKTDSKVPINMMVYGGLYLQDDLVTVTPNNYLTIPSSLQTVQATFNFTVSDGRLHSLGFMFDYELLYSKGITQFSVFVTDLSISLVKVGKPFPIGSPANAKQITDGANSEIIQFSDYKAGSQSGGVYASIKSNAVAWSSIPLTASTVDSGTLVTNYALIPTSWGPTEPAPIAYQVSCVMFTDSPVPINVSVVGGVFLDDEFMNSVSKLMLPPNNQLTTVTFNFGFSDKGGNPFTFGFDYAGLYSQNVKQFSVIVYDLNISQVNGTAPTKLASPGASKIITEGDNQQNLEFGDFEKGDQAGSVSINKQTSGVSWSSIALTASTQRAGKINTDYSVKGVNWVSPALPSVAYQVICIMYTDSSVPINIMVDGGVFLDDKLNNSTAVLTLLPNNQLCSAVFNFAIKDSNVSTFNLAFDYTDLFNKNVTHFTVNIYNVKIIELDVKKITAPPPKPVPIPPKALGSKKPKSSKTIIVAVIIILFLLVLGCCIYFLI